MSHPNKAPFKGVLARVDEVSDKSPSGARGHKVFLTQDAAVSTMATRNGILPVSRRLMATPKRFGSPMG